jgi:transcriptional regulator with XRE-family HTH domain
MTEDELEGADTPATALDATALRHARHEANLTQAQLAERLGVRVLAVEQWEWGTRPIPASLVPAIRGALDVSPGPPAAEVAAASPEPPREDTELVESLFEQATSTTARLQKDVAAFMRRIEELEDAVEDSERRLFDATSRQTHEALLRDTLVTAQKAAAEVREDARRGATLALRKARRRARRMLDEAEQERARAAHAATEAARLRRTIEAELEQLTRAAREEAERVLREAEHERRRIRDEIVELERTAEEHRAQMAAILRSMLERVEARDDEPPLAEVIFKHEMARRRAAPPEAS